MKTIKLCFAGGLSSLCGNPFGKKVFEDQVEKFCSEEEPVEVFFPDSIDSISMSFAQGFVSVIAEKYGMPDVTKHIIVNSAHERVVRKFNEAISMRN